MSDQHVRNVLERSCSRNVSRVVLLVLAERTGLDGTSYLSIRLLAREANVSRSALHLALSRLVGLGEIAIGYNAGPKGCNVYRLLCPYRKQDHYRKHNKGVPETRQREYRKRDPNHQGTIRNRQ